MNALDQIFSWLMIAFGVAQSVTNFRIQSSSHLTLSLSGTAAAMIVSGFLNVSRVRHSDGLTRAFSVIGNLLILVLAVGIAWPVRYHLLHNWQALGILVVTVVELSFALRGKPVILAGFEHFGLAHPRVHAVALCQQISRDAEPFRIEWFSANGLTCATIPVGGIALIAFLTMEVGVHSCTIWSFVLLGGFVGLRPIAFGIPPQAGEGLCQFRRLCRAPIARIVFQKTI